MDQGEEVNNITCVRVRKSPVVHKILILGSKLHEGSSVKKLLLYFPLLISANWPLAFSRIFRDREILRSDS